MATNPIKQAERWLKTKACVGKVCVPRWLPLTVGVVALGVGALLIIPEPTAGYGINKVVRDVRTLIATPFSATRQTFGTGNPMF